MKRKILAALISLSLVAVAVTGCGGKTSGGSGVKGELNLFVWTEYLPDSVVDKFEK